MQNAIGQADLLRRPFLLFVAIVTVATLVLSACGEAKATPTGVPTAKPTVASQATTPPTSVPSATIPPTVTAVPTATARPAPTATAVPVPTGNLSLVFDSLIDQVFLPDSGARRRYMEPIFDWMIGADLTGKLDAKRGFISSWEANADSTVWTVKVRDNVVFHSGDTATSKDVKGSFDFSLRDASGVSGRDATKAKIKAIETPDNSTVIFRLASTDIFFSNVMSPMDTQTSSFLMPTVYYQSVGDNGFTRRPVGSGPYKVKDNVIGDKITYEATPRHWLHGVPQFASMEFRLVPEVGTRVALLKSGDIDVAKISPLQAADVTRAGFGLYSKRGAYTAFLSPHEQWKAGNPIGNAKVRQALSLAIDRQVLVDKFLAGQGTPTLNYPHNVGDIAYLRLPVTKQDLPKAKQLLGEAGFPNGFTLDMPSYFINIDNAAEIMEAIAVWWEGVGLKVNRLPTTYATWRTQQVKDQSFPNPTVSGIVAAGGRIIATPLFNALLDPSSTSLLSKEPDLHPMVVKVIQAKSIDEYSRGVRDLQQQMIERMIVIPLAEVGDVFAANPRKVTRWDLGLSSSVFNVPDLVRRA